MSEPIAYFLTWTTYGTWLHGDRRGSVDAQHNVFGAEFLPPNAARREQEKNRMREPPLQMRHEERMLVEQAISRHCALRGWELIQVNCRSNHVHVIVKALDAPETVMRQLKANSTIALKVGMDRTRFWTEGGSKRRIFDEEGLRRAIHYVLNQ